MAPRLMPSETNEGIMLVRALLRKMHANELATIMGYVPSIVRRWAKGQSPNRESYAVIRRTAGMNLDSEELIAIKYLATNSRFYYGEELEDGKQFCEKQRQTLCKTHRA